LATSTLAQENEKVLEVIARRAFDGVAEEEWKAAARNFRDLVAADPGNLVRMAFSLQWLRMPFLLIQGRGQL